MWWRKRPQPEGGSVDEGGSKAAVKRARTTKSYEEKMKDVHDVQLELQLLEERCADDQISIQLKYDEMRKPHFKKRRDLLKQIPGFWKDALRGHPMNLTHSIELEALSHLQDIEVHENTDRNGSYEVRATFHDNSLFKEKTILKKVVYHDVTGERIEAATLTSASEQGQKLLDAVRSAQRSVIGWFLRPAAAAEDTDDFGHVLRRDLWQDPVPYFLSVHTSAGDAASAAGAGASKASEAV
mmetsp:Transcript_100039/g.182535  ORF Transcript_100039/g.182535 Transcript_100039/m.182535 type:complete len:240 (+) Transcript_100039:86-805(+)